MIMWLLGYQDAENPKAVSQVFSPRRDWNLPGRALGGLPSEMSQGAATLSQQNPRHLHNTQALMLSFGGLGKKAKI